MKFPKNFLFGSATAAHQIEGGQKNDWSEWEKKAGRITDGSDSTIACDSWNKWLKDIALLKKTNQNAYRFSIEWSRIEPEEGRFSAKAIARYKKMLLELKRRGIASMVTLFHFSLPLWLSRIGGFANKKSVYYFSRFAEKMAKEFGQIVYLWVTINEPQGYLLDGYIIGDHCPGEKNLFKAFFVIRKNLEKAHIEAYKKMKPLVKGSVGAVEHLVALKPIVPGFLNHLWVRITHFFTTIIFIQPIIKYTDFIGINYYHKFKVQFWSPRITKASKILNDFGWGINQEGLYQVIMESARWRKPMYITENGIADAKDQHRADFIRDAFKNIEKALKKKADLRGYFHWTLLDNFEWAKGYTMKFGLFTRDRLPRPSANFYAEQIKNYSS